MDPVPIVIVFVSVTLTTIIAILSIQVWNILKEFRGSLIRMNKILDDAVKVSGNATAAVEGLSGAMSGIKGVFSLLSSFRRKEKTYE